MDKLHVIHSRNGKIGLGTDTNPEDLDALVTAAAQHPSRHLILHFHGGLVSKADGTANAATMIEAYKDAGYPVFFVWESSWWEAIRNNLAELRDEPAVQGLERKIIFWVIKKLGMPMLPGADAPALLDLAGADIVVRAEMAKAELDTDEVEADLAADPDFRRSLATLPGLSDSDHAELGVNMLIAERRTAVGTILSEQLKGDAFIPEGGGLLWRAALYVVKVAWNVFDRFQAKRDHGVHATCMEELVRAIKLGGSTASDWGRTLEWDRMKKDTRDAFEKTTEVSLANPELHAGTALLARLRDAIAAKRMQLDRITLVGHSTGAIYIANWLRHCGDYLPAALKHDLVFLAPAITYDDFADLLATNQDKIGKFRMFAMKDEVERIDQVIGNDMETAHTAASMIYPSSLLYLVSGLLETRTENGKQVDEPDKPLLGLQRFYKNTEVYRDSEFPAIKQVVAWLDSANHTVVWSISEGQLDGLNCPCNDHGSFGGKFMIPTLRHIVSKGF